MVKYFLAHGYNTEEWNDCVLSKILGDVFNTLESIDKFTSKYSSLEQLKNEFFYKNYIESLEEDVVIATNKKDKADNQYKLRKIFNSKLLFKDDLAVLGIESFDCYINLAKYIEKYLKTKVYDIKFLSSILDEYIEKYNFGGTDIDRKEAQVSIVTDGTLKYLKKCVDKGVLPDNNIYLTRYYNLFFSEMYKCKLIFDENNIRKHIPYRSQINNKGLHDLLIHIVIYEKELFLEMNNFHNCDEAVERDNEEFIEERDYDYLVKNYVSQNGIDLDLKNEDEEIQDDYIRAAIEGKSLLKKGDGIE